MTARRRLFYAICLLLGGAFLGLLAAEGLVRVLFPQSRDHVMPAGFVTMDGDLGWRLQPGKTVTHRSRLFSVTYATNSLGYRDGPRNVEKPEDVHRVLLYGDSQVFGWGIPTNQRFSNVLETELPSVEIWNMAVPGYGLDQQLLSYERQGRQLNADEVVFYVSRNTLWRTRFGLLYHKSKPRFVPDEQGHLRRIPPPQSGHAWRTLMYEMMSPFYLPYFLERRLASLSDRPREPSRNRDPSGADRAAKALGEFEMDLLDEAGRVVADGRHKLTLLSYLDEEAARELHEWCEREGIQCVAIPFAAITRDRVLSDDDTHFNARAHRFIAHELAGALAGP